MKVFRGIRFLHFVLLACLFVPTLNSCSKNKDSAKPSSGAHFDKKITVAKDGSGDFKSVQKAINSIEDFSTDTTLIYIKNGVYKERIKINEYKGVIRLVGESREDVVLTFGNYAANVDPETGEEIGTFNSGSFYLYSSDFIAKNITFENSHGKGSQAVAILIYADRVQFINCKFLGFQDTIYSGLAQSSSKGRQYFKDCWIKGATDFIFGNGTAVFDSCTIYCMKGGQYITAASTPEGNRFGFVFRDCKITGDAPDNSYFLGRPWKPYARTVFLNCDLGNMIRPEGWFNWDDPSKEKTAYYAEYNNTGESANTSERVNWVHLLTETEAGQYTLDNIFGDWNP